MAHIDPVLAHSEGVRHGCQQINVLRSPNLSREHLWSHQQISAWSLNVFLVVNKASLVTQMHIGGQASKNASSLLFDEQMTEDKNQSISCHLHSSTKLRPTQPPTDRTRRRSGELSQTPNAELMGADGGGVTASASCDCALISISGGNSDQRSPQPSRQSAQTKQRLSVDRTWVLL